MQLNFFFSELWLICVLDSSNTAIHLKMGALLQAYTKSIAVLPQFKEVVNLKHILALKPPFQM